MRPGILFVAMLLLGGVAIFVAVSSAGGGHGTYLPAKLLFPFTMLLAGPNGPIAFFGIAVALLQFPVYGFALAAAATGGKLKPVAGVVVSLHAAAVAVALFVPQSTFPS